MASLVLLFAWYTTLNPKLSNRKHCQVDRAKSELIRTTWRLKLSHVVFLDQNFVRNKNILGKKPKS